MVTPKNKIKRSFSPVYLAVFSGIILIIVIVNGLLEINRAQRGFYLFLEKEGGLLMQHMEKNIQDTFTSLAWLENGPLKDESNVPVSDLLFALENTTAEYLLEAIHQTDQMDRKTPMTSSDLRALADQYRLTSIIIYSREGKRLRQWPPSFSPKQESLLLQELIGKKRLVVSNLFRAPLLEKNLFSIASWRQDTPEIVAFYLNGEQMKELLRQFALQRTVSETGLSRSILYLSIQDAGLNILAHTNPEAVGKKAEEPFLKEVLLHPQVHSRMLRFVKGEKVFEVAKSFSLHGSILGVIRIGYSTQEIHPLIRQIAKNVALSVFFFLIFGISATTLIWVNQNRHIKKTEELEARVQLAERLSSLGHLAAGVAHEIRNPLNAMGMGLQRLRREFLPTEESKRKEYLSFTELILKEVKRVNEIIEQFLTLSRPSQLNRREASLQDLLKNLIMLFQEEASSMGIMFQTNISSDIPPLKIDAEKLTQALINIMKNGMQAMEQGGTFRIGAGLLKDGAEIVFSDSGKGIPPEEMEKIFNYYYTTKEKGVGLGLPIAHRIIEAHGGQLTVESQGGSGTTVTVKLPFA